MKPTTYQIKHEHIVRPRLVHSNENPFVGHKPSRAFLAALDAVTAMKEKNPED